MRYKRNRCPECKTNPRPGQRYCLKCHAAYIRGWRKLNKTPTQTTPGGQFRKYSRTPRFISEQRKRANARSYAHVYRDRGKLKRQPCIVCGAVKAEMHHEDYSKPLEVTWLCRPCHLSLHKKQRQHGP